MTVADGLALLALAAAVGFGLGYLYGHAEDRQWSAGFDEGYAARTADTEDLLRKGGPPTPEAMSDTDNTDTPGNSDATDTEQSR